MKKENLNLNFLLFAIISVIQIYINYQGNYHPFYIDIYDYNINNNLYPNDEYLKDTPILKSSIFFILFNFFKINLNNDFINLSLYIFANIIGISFLNKILKEYFFIGDLKFRLILILSAFFSQISLSYVQPIFFSSHTGSITALVMPLITVIIYYYLKKKLTLTLILNISCALLSFRNFWMLILMWNFYLVFFYYSFSKKHLFKIFLIFLSLLIPVIILKTLSQPIIFNHDEKIKLIEIMFQRGGAEDSLFLHDKFIIIKTIILFCLAFIMVSKKNNIDIELKKFFKIFIICNFLILILYYFFTKNIYLYLPFHEIIFINPIRINYIFNLFFSIIFLKYLIVNIKSKNNILIIFSILIFLNIFGISKNFFIISFFISIIYLIFSKYYFFNKNFFSIFLILFVFYQFIKIYDDKIFNLDTTLLSSEYRFTKIGRYNTEKLKSLLYLKSCKDFRLIFLDNTNIDTVNSNFKNINNYNLNNYLNWIIKKSKYIGEISHLYLKGDLKTLNNHLKKEKDIKLLLSNINNPNFLNTLEKILINEENLVIILDSKKNFENLNKINFKKIEQFTVFYINTKLESCFNNEKK